MDLMLLLPMIGGYLVLGGMICTAIFDKGERSHWLDRFPSWVELPIWMLWPVAVPLCMWLACRWWRS